MQNELKTETTRETVGPMCSDSKREDTLKTRYPKRAVEIHFESVKKRIKWVAEY